MAATTPNRGDPSVSIVVQATIAERPAELKTIVAYAFSQGGKLLDAQALDPKGGATLSVPASREPQAFRVVLGPEIEKNLIDVGELLRRGGIDRHVAWRPAMNQLAPVAFEVGPELWRPWLGRRCVVDGTLLKRIVSGGVTLNLPVCNAAIDIYEVDPWPRIIVELPEIDFDRLREIIDGPWPPRDWPVPPPPPPDRLIGNLLDDPLSRVALNPQPLPPRLGAGTIRGFDPQPDPPADRRRALLLPADLRLAARAARPALERAVIANIDLLRPVLCHLFPLRVRRTRLLTVMTDECGHFHAVIWRSIIDLDQPDLYFVARQRIFNAIWITILEPTPVACHTWWNYVCGSHVTLITTHPLAHGCPPCPPIVAPNNWVLFMAIGNTSVWRIHGANDTTRVGVAGHDPARLGLLDGSSPWGGSLRPRLEFDSSLRSDLGVMYYRVSFKRPAEDETAWRPSSENVSRHFTHEVGGDLILEQYPLGPRVVGSSAFLYEIPPALPSSGQWSLPNVVLDTQSALFPTTAYAPGTGFDGDGTPTGTDAGGLWQIKVELFDSSGALVDPEGLGITWRVPRSDDLSGTIQTRNAAALGLVDAARNCMIVTVQVDNNPTYARIDAPTIGGVAAADECGVMNYSSRALGVSVPFVALQRNRHASWWFYVQRGAVSPAEYAIAGTAAPNPAAMPGAIPPSPPAAALPTVDSLLDACTLAGFSEVLHVEHAGTDGWSRLSGYDSNGVRAFVLAPVAGP